MNPSDLVRFSKRGQQSLQRRIYQVLRGEQGGDGQLPLRCGDGNSRLSTSSSPQRSTSTPSSRMENASMAATSFSFIEAGKQRPLCDPALPDGFHEPLRRACRRLSSSAPSTTVTESRSRVRLSTCSARQTEEFTPPTGCTFKTLGDLSITSSVHGRISIPAATQKGYHSADPFVKFAICGTRRCGDRPGRRQGQIRPFGGRVLLQRRHLLRAARDRVPADAGRAGGRAAGHRQTGSCGCLAAGTVSRLVLPRRSPSGRQGAACTFTCSSRRMAGTLWSEDGRLSPLAGR